MKSQFLSIGLLTSLTVFAVTGLPAARTLTTQDPHDHATAQSTAPKDQPAPRGRQMMGGRMGGPAAMKCEQMMATVKADDTRVTTAVSRMNDAKGEAKVAAMADLLNLLVEGRKQMHEMMMACPMGMMPAK